MADGKIRAGMYRCNQFTIERAATGMWWVYRSGQLAHAKPFSTQGAACRWCRYPGAAR